VDCEGYGETVMAKEMPIVFFITWVLLDVLIAFYIGGVNGYSPSGLINNTGCQLNYSTSCENTSNWKFADDVFTFTFFLGLVLFILMLARG
jgi:hypothetical protein